MLDMRGNAHFGLWFDAEDGVDYNTHKRRRWADETIDWPFNALQFAWQHYAACRESPDDFTLDDIDLRGAHRTLNRMRNRCEVCPVIDDCLDDAIESGDHFTFRAGMTPNQRTRYIRGLRRRLPAQPERPVRQPTPSLQERPILVVLALIDAWRWA